MMFTYLFGFVIPFAYNIISDNLIYYRDNAKDESNLHLSFRIFNYLLASFTSILFSYFEIIEIKSFRPPWIQITNEISGFGSKSSRLIRLAFITKLTN